MLTLFNSMSEKNPGMYRIDGDLKLIKNDCGIRFYSREKAQILVFQIIDYNVLKVLSHEFFGGRRSSAGSRLFALLLGSFLLSAALRSSRLL